MLGLGSSLTGGVALDDFPNKYSIEFDGTDDYISLGDLDGNAIHYSSSNLTCHGVTISMWVKLDTLQTTGFWCNDGVGDATYSGMWVQVNAAGRPMLQYGDGSGNSGSARKGRISGSGDALTTGTWYHLVYVFASDDRADWKIYKDKISITLANSGSYSGTVGYEAGTAPGGIGARGDFNGIDGKMCDVAVWNTALGQDEVTSIYNNGKPNDLEKAASYTSAGGSDKSGNLVAYWKMEEGSGTSVADAKGDYDGTFVASPTWSTDTP